MMYRSLIPMEPKLTPFQVERGANHFLKVKKLSDLAMFFAMEKHQLMLMAQNPSYETFYLPKPHGGQRLIEAPAKALKKLQDRLGQFLQCVYYQIKPPCAFGFVLVPMFDPNPRHILSNARQHFGCKWLLNVDLKDFFHQITTDQIAQLFRADPFRMSREAARCLAMLTTFHGWLPMGAPSSPVLSNFAAMAMDRHLMALAQKYGWTYTRYADDLSFSSEQPFLEGAVERILAAVESTGFVVNPDKVRFQRAEDKPEVTGLVLKKDTVDVSADFLAGIEEDLRVLDALSSERMALRGIFNKRPVKKLRRSIQGQINFVAFIRGKHHKSVQKLEGRLYQNTRKYSS